MAAWAQPRIVEPVNGDYISGSTQVTLAIDDTDGVLATRILVNDAIAAEAEGWQAAWTIDFGEDFAARRIVAEVTRADGTVQRSETVRTRELAISVTARAELILIGAVVKSRRNEAIRDLEEDEFTVSLNNRQVPIEFFDTNQLPLDVVLMLDTSSSLRGKGFPDLQQAGRVFVSQLRPNDRALLYEFKDEPSRLSDFTSGQASLTKLIDELEPLGATALFDALHQGLDSFGGERKVRKALVLFTDGKDSVYEEPQKKADMLRSGIIKAQNSEVTIYTIGLGENIHKDALRVIAEDTGGRFHHANYMERLPAIFGEIIEELKHQYVLGIDPQAARPGFNKIDVEVDKRRAEVYTRKGFTRD